MAAQAGASGVPKWLLDCREQITRSKEWEFFIEELHDAVEQQLTESHVQTFSDLTSPERTLFLERAARAIREGEAYSVVYKVVSRLLDQYMSDDVGRQLMEEYPLKTKSDLFLEDAQEGVVCLLRLWPDLKMKLHACFNNPLPMNLRKLAWRLFLENEKARKRYMDLLSSNPRKAISPQDLDISRKCEQLLMSEPTFDELNGSVGAFYGMKAILSYHHALKRTDHPLPDTDYMLTIPLLYIVQEKIPRNEPANIKLVTMLVEEYLALLDNRHPIMRDDGSEEHATSLHKFAEKVAQHIARKSPETMQYINQAHVTDKEKIVATEAGSVAATAEAVTSLMRPAIRSLFVGYLSMEVVLYIWDQYLIGSDVRGYHDELLPAITAIYLILLKDQLKNCHSPSAMHATLKKESPRLKASQFQYQMSQHFYDDLVAILNQEEKAAMPVLDPTQSRFDPWDHWHKDRLPPRTDNKERHLAREAREAERLRQLQEAKRKQMDQKQLDEREREEERKRLLRQAEDVRGNDRKERNRLLGDLEQERKRRVESERAAAEQIERLRKELDDLKKQQRGRAPSGQSFNSIWSGFPAVSPQRGTPATISAAPSIRVGPTPRQTPRPSRPPSNARNDPQRPPEQAAIDLMAKVQESFDILANGRGEDRRELDEATRNDLANAPSPLPAAPQSANGGRRSGTENDGRESGTGNDGTGSGARNDGTGSGARNDGTGSGARNDGTGSGARNDGTGSGAGNEGRKSGAGNSGTGSRAGNDDEDRNVPDSQRDGVS